MIKDSKDTRTQSVCYWLSVVGEGKGGEKGREGKGALLARALAPFIYAPSTLKVEHLFY